MTTLDWLCQRATKLSIIITASSLALPLAMAADDAEEYIEEIIVTAEKREENILEVPVTMSAFKAEMIEQLGMTAQEDLEQLVPGLQFGYDSEGYGIAMRGVGTQVAVQTQADQAVAFYVDGVYSYKTYGTSPHMFDLARVEVARGPQGTLNGRNSIAGAVSFVHQRPTDELDLNVLVEFTDQFTQRYGVAFGGPINDNFSYRLTGSYYEGDGAQENLGIGADYDKPDQNTISPQLRFQSDRLDMNLRYFRLKDTGTSRSRVTVTEKDRNDPETAVFGPWLDPNNWFLYDKPVPSVSDCPPGQYTEFGGICDDLTNKVLSNRGSQQENDAERWSFNANFQLTDELSLRYTYGENESHTFGSEDTDATDRVGSTADPSIPADLTDPALIQRWIDEEGFLADTEDAWLDDDEESSHELQLFSNFNGPLNFVAGVYTYENKSSWRDRQHNWANPLNTTNAEEAVARIDLDRDGQPDYGSCQEFYDEFVLGVLEWDPSEAIRCQQGNNHDFSTGGGAGATSETNAAFVSGDYRLNDQWQISGGLRWTEDKKSLLPEINGDHGVVGFLPRTGGLFSGDIEDDQLLGSGPWGGVPIWIAFILDPRDGSWRKTIGHVSLEYTPEANRLYYGRISTGFRAGGFNQIEEEDTQELIDMGILDANFKGSELINYEVGVKGLFLDNRLTLMAGAYFQDYKGFHWKATTFLPQAAVGNREYPFTDFTSLIDGTEIWGAEVEWMFFLNDNWRLSGFYNYLDSSIGRHSAFFFFDDRDADNPTFTHTFTDPVSSEQLSVEYERPREVTGNTLPQQPKHKGALTLHYTQPLENLGSLSLLTTWSYIGERFADIGNVSYQSLFAYSRWDVRATWESPDHAWRVTGYVQNALDEIGIQEFADNNVWLTEHRQIGVQVRWQPQL